MTPTRLRRPIAALEGPTPTPTPRVRQVHQRQHQPRHLAEPVLRQLRSPQARRSWMATRWRAHRGHYDNHYWRAFNMNTFTGGLEYDITSVEFGIELGAEEQAQDNRLRSICMPITARRFLMVPDQDRHVWLAQYPRPGRRDIQPADRDKRTGWDTGVSDGSSRARWRSYQQCLLYRLESRSREPRTSYISAADCGTPDPVPVADIGFPDMHYVINVNGSCPAGSPTPTATATATLRQRQRQLQLQLRLRLCRRGLHRRRGRGLRHHHAHKLQRLVG